MVTVARNAGASEDLIAELEARLQRDQRLEDERRAEEAARAKGEEGGAGSGGERGSPPTDSYAAGGTARAGDRIEPSSAPVDPDHARQVGDVSTAERVSGIDRRRARAPEVGASGDTAMSEDRPEERELSRRVSAPRSMSLDQVDGLAEAYDRASAGALMSSSREPRTGRAIADAAYVRRTAGESRARRAAGLAADDADLNAALSRATASGADLRNLQLGAPSGEGPTLRDQDLTGADLSGSDLRGVRFSRTTLRGADLSRADLSGADMTGVDLSGATLTDANLAGANLEGARWDARTKLPAGFDPRARGMVDARRDDRSLPGPLNPIARFGRAVNELLPQPTDSAHTVPDPTPRAAGEMVPELVDDNGVRFPTNADRTRYAMPRDPTQATPRQFLENHVLPTLRDARGADGQPLYPKSVEEMERFVDRLSRAEAGGHRMSWDLEGNSWSRGVYDGAGDLRGVDSGINARLVHAWNNVDAAVRLLPASQRLAHLHEAAGRFMEDATHELGHRQVFRGYDRVFNPSVGREENVRRLTEHKLADEASRARNGHRVERTFAAESDRRGGYRAQRDHSIFQRAHDDFTSGRLSASEAQQKVIDEIANGHPNGTPPGTTYRDEYRRSAEWEADRLARRHERRAADLGRAPADAASTPERGAGGDAPGSGAQHGRRIVDDVVRLQLDEAYRNGPEALRDLRNQLGDDHRRMMDEMLARQYDGDAARLQAALERDTGLDPERVKKKLEGYDRGRTAAAERERVRLEEARRRADEVSRYPTTQAYADEARRGMADADRMIAEIERGPDFQGRSTLLQRLRSERDELAALTDRDRRLGDITDKNVAGANNNIRGYGREWSDIEARLRSGHHVQYGGGADVVDHTAREAIQHKASASADPNQVRHDLQRANEQLGGGRGERPPEGYRRIVQMDVDGSSHLGAEDPGTPAHRQRLLDEAADAFAGRDVSFDEVRFRYPDAGSGPVEVSFSRAEVEGRIRARAADASGPRDAQRAPEPGRTPGSALDPEVQRSIRPEVAAQIADEDLRRLSQLTPDASSRRSVSSLIRGAESPEDLRRIASALEGVPEASRQAITRVIANLSADSQAALGRVLGSLSGEHGADFLRIAQHLDGRGLGEALGAIDTAVSNLRRVAPGMLDDAGKMFGAMSQMVSRLGLDLGRVAGRVLRGVGAMLPAVGTAFAAYDMVRMGQVAADGSLPPELRFLGGAGVALNGMDAALGVAEMFGIGNIGLPANLALGAAALGLDLYTHHQIDRFRANPDGWRPSRELNAFVAGTGLAMGPSGAALMIGMFGPTGAQAKMLDLGQVGGELAIEAARLGGVAQADAAGQGLRFTAAGIDALADMVRNPERFGQALGQLGVSARELGRNAITALGTAAQAAGELGQRAASALGDAGNYLMEQGQRGLETLEWMLENPGEVGRIAQDRIVDLIQRGGELGRRALDGLENLGQRGLDTAERAIAALSNAGERGLEMLQHAWTRFRDNPSQAFRDLGNAAIDGVSSLARQGGELGRKAVRSLIDFVNAQPRMAERAVESLRDLARQGGDALREIGSAWSRNLTDGGREVMRALENLGGAGVEALERLGAYGGDLAREGANALGRIYDRGVTSARNALERVTDALSPENLRRFLIDAPATAARAAFDRLGGDRLSQVVQGLARAPEQLRQLYDRMSWSNVRRAFGDMTRDAKNALLGALDPSRMHEFIRHFDAPFLRSVYDATSSWERARRMFETVSSDLSSKLAEAIGPERLASLVGAGATSADWIGRNLGSALENARLLADTMRGVSSAALGRLRDALGVERITSTLRWMRDQGIAFGDRLVDGARALGDSAIQTAMGIVEQVAPVNDLGYRALPNGRVPPWDPRARWWFGLRNPFR